MCYKCGSKYSCNCDVIQLTKGTKGEKGDTGAVGPKGDTGKMIYRLSFINSPLFIGDSYTVGIGASPISESFVNKLTVNNNIVAQNGGISGVGAWRACSQYFQTRPSSLSVNPTVWLCGFNDLRRAGNNSATYEKIKGALKSVILNTWANSFTPASTVTNTGTWSNATGYGGKCEGTSTGSARQSSTVGNTLTYTSPASSNIVIGCFGSDGTISDCGRFTVTIDGVLVDTFTPNGKTDGVSDGVYNNAITQNCLFYENLSNTTHTVVVTLLDAKPTIIDYFGTIGEPNLNPAVFVLDIPKMTTAGYATAPANASDAIMNLGIAAQKSVIDLFINRPIIQVFTNDYLNLSTDISGDNVHPNNLGHTHIAQAIQASIKSNSDFIIHGKTNNPTNTVIGDGALNSDYVNSYNTVIGYNAGYANDLGSQNVVMGYFAMRNVTGTSSYNVAIGLNALKEGANITNTVAIGHSSLSNLTTGTQNVAIGPNSLKNLTNGYNNTALGVVTGRSLTSGTFNVLIGTEAYKTGNGDFNTCLGYASGSNSTGSSNVFIGYSAGSNELGNNKLYIANTNTANPLIYGDFGTGYLKFNASKMNLSSLPTTNSGVASGEIYFDTAANALLNGDKIAIRKT